MEELFNDRVKIIFKDYQNLIAEVNLFLISRGIPMDTTKTGLAKLIAKKHLFYHIFKQDSSGKERIEFDNDTESKDVENFLTENAYDLKQRYSVVFKNIQRVERFLEFNIIQG